MKELELFSFLISEDSKGQERWRSPGWDLGESEWGVEPHCDYFPNIRLLEHADSGVCLSLNPSLSIVGPRESTHASVS